MLLDRLPWPATTAWAFLLLNTSSAHSQSLGTIEGFAHPYRSAEVATSTSGIIKEWLVEEGEEVQAGQPLVQLDATVHQTMVDIAETAVESRGELVLAEAEQRLRTQRLTAIQELATQGHATPDELFRAESEWEVATARVLVAKESHLRREMELKKLKAQLKAFVVVAPYDGVVAKVHRLAGEYVGPVDPAVCEIVELENLSARFLTSSDLVERVPNGSQVEVLFVASGIKVRGTATVSPYPDAETGMRLVRVKLANPKGELPAGVRCKLLLEGLRADTPASSLSVTSTSAGH